MKRLKFVILAVAALMAALALAGCRTVEYVPVETVRTDTVREARAVRDSVAVVDSVYVAIKGDTVYHSRWRVVWRDRWRTDTVYRSRRDTVSVPVPVERRLTRWQQAKQDWGGTALAVVAVGICAAVWWLARKFRR